LGFFVSKHTQTHPIQLQVHPVHIQTYPVHIQTYPVHIQGQSIMKNVYQSSHRIAKEAKVVLFGHLKGHLGRKLSNWFGRSKSAQQKIVITIMKETEIALGVGQSNFRLFKECQWTIKKLIIMATEIPQFKQMANQLDSYGVGLTLMLCLLLFFASDYRHCLWDSRREHAIFHIMRYIYHLLGLKGSKYLGCPKICPLNHLILYHPNVCFVYFVFLYIVNIIFYFYI